MADSKRKVKVICEVCKGNGFAKEEVPNMIMCSEGEEQWADCDFCNK